MSGIDKKFLAVLDDAIVKKNGTINTDLYDKLYDEYAEDIADMNRQSKRYNSSFDDETLKNQVFDYLPTVNRGGIWEKNNDLPYAIALYIGNDKDYQQEALSIIKDKTKKSPIEKDLKSYGVTDWMFYFDDFDEFYGAFEKKYTEESKNFNFIEDLSKKYSKQDVKKVYDKIHNYKLGGKIDGFIKDGKIFINGKSHEFMIGDDGDIVQDWLKKKSSAEVLVKKLRHIATLRENNGGKQRPKDLRGIADFIENNTKLNTKMKTGGNINQLWKTLEDNKKKLFISTMLKKGMLFDEDVYGGIEKEDYNDLPEKVKNVFKKYNKIVMKKGGLISVGDNVKILPTGKTMKVTSIAKNKKGQVEFTGADGVYLIGDLQKMAKGGELEMAKKGTMLEENAMTKAQIKKALQKYMRKEPKKIGDKEFHDIMLSASYVYGFDLNSKKGKEITNYIFESISANFYPDNIVDIVMRYLEKVNKINKAEKGTNIKTNKMATNKKLDKEYAAQGPGERTSKKFATIYRKDGSSFRRKNANQYYPDGVPGGEDYTEKRINRTDKNLYYEDGGSVAPFVYGIGGL